MTREEIIEQLDSIVDTYEILLGHGVNSDILDVDDIEAIEEAISALSENKGDLISREKLKDYLDRNISFGGVEKKFAFFDIIDSIPSAENKGDFDGMTNGEVIQALFPYVEAKDTFFNEFIGTNLDEGYFLLRKEWWNAPYKAESEEKK